jgi:NTE family protein
VPIGGEVMVMSEKTTFSRKTFEPNRTIFDEGDPADTVYILRSGAVEIRIGTRGDYPRTLTKVKVGDVFGELALLEKRSHEAAAFALEESEVLEVPRDEFIKRLNASDPVMKTVVNHLVSRLREMTSEFKKR